MLHNPIFAVIFILGFAGTIATEGRKILKRSVVYKIIYGILAVLSVLMFLDYWFEWRLTFPTLWITDRLYPFIKLIKG